LAESNNYGPVLLGLGQYAVFTSFLPKITEVRNTTPGDSAAVADLRLGETMACGVSLVIGAAASAMTGNPLAFITSFLVCAVMVAVYEYTLYNSPFGPTKNPEKETTS